MSSFGLYCPPEDRLYVDRFDRSDNLVPAYRRIAPAVDTFPKFLIARLLAEFERRAPLQWLGESVESADAWLERTAAALEAAHLNVGFDSSEITARAERWSDLSYRLKDFAPIAQLADTMQLPMPLGNRDSTEDSLAKRCYEPKTWRRAMEKTYTRSAENKLREIGFVARRDQLYCTDLGLAWFRGKMRAQVEYLKSHAVESDGEQLNLFDVQQRSVSNPAIRRAELMTRMSGFEAIARDSGHVAEFITLTVPSKFHATLSTGEPNPTYEGATVRDAQAWLSKMWTRSRSKLARLSILVYGFRIAEPHHDGTPHWHMVLFTLASARRTLLDVLRGYWLSECGSEPGAANHRIKFKSINYAQGSATGYIAKYVAKNIDGFEVGEDFETIPDDSGTGEVGGNRQSAEGASDASQEGKNRTDATNTVARVRAWASLHGIRQFQQIGGPCVTLYRELRRIRVDRVRVEGQSRPLVDVAPIERARVPADAGDWAGYVAAVGGIEVGRSTCISLWKELTGECNAYGECRAAQIVGITAPLVGKVKTHTQIWRVIRVLSESSLGPVSITVLSGIALSDSHGWTNPNETSMYGPKETH